MQDTLGIFVILVAAIFLAVQLCERFPWAAKLSEVTWVLLLAALASNLGLIPLEHTLYEGLAGLTVPFAVCLILLEVRLGDLRRAGKAMGVAFGLASVGTVLGVLAAGLALDPLLAGVVGPDRWKIAGPYTGTYIGGSLNFFALWSGLEIGQPDLFAAANAVDNLTLIPLLATWTLVPSLLGGRFPVSARWQGAGVATEESAGAMRETPRLRLGHLLGLALIALSVMWVSLWVKQHWLDAIVPGIPSILVVTTLALLIGHVPGVARLEGAWDLGHLAFYLFFAAVGAMIHVHKAIVLSPILFVYVLIVIAVHMGVVYGLGRLLRLDVGVLTLASTAASAGPALVPAIAETRGWHHLALPGVLVGLLGYALGNYAGFAVASAMRVLVGA